MTTNGKENDKDQSTHEKRAQTIMLGIIMILLGWSFNSLVQLGKDMEAVKVQLVNVPAIQQKVNDHSLEINGLRIDEDNSKRRLSDLESRKR